MKDRQSSSETDDFYKNRPLVLFWSARLLTTLAYQMLSVAVGWQIYALTGSPLYLGLIGFAQFLPTLLMTLPAGHVVDRYDRRLVFSMSQIIQGIGVFALAAGSYAGWLNKDHMLFIVFIIGSARTFTMPASQALLPNLVSPVLFARATALTASLSQVGFIAGPALGGFLYAAGPTVVYISVGAAFLIAALIIFRIRLEGKPGKREPVSLRSVFAGIVFIKAKPAILGAISLDLFAVLLGGATALLPIYAKEILITGPWGLGFLRSAPAVGALLMSLFLAHVSLNHHLGRTMFSAVIVFGLTTMAFAISTSLAISLALLVILGAADMISVVIRQSLVQIETPDAMRGRVSAVNSLFIGTSNQLGEFESGVTAAWFGTKAAVLIGGLGTIVVATVWMRFFPALAKIDNFDTSVKKA
ncbi:MAG TPA: MFS transporter [Syntrophorhabdaceae bacterium]|nr:MFS transporter [Syntrophorhabdaceae bacterium]